MTHGTDSLLASASACAEAVTAAGIDKTVVFTGALKPGAFKDTDADFNVGFALGALEALPARPGRVLVAMQGQLLAPEEAGRCLESGHFVHRK